MSKLFFVAGNTCFAVGAVLTLVMMIGIPAMFISWEVITTCFSILGLAALCYDLEIRTFHISKRTRCSN